MSREPQDCVVIDLEIEADDEMYERMGDIPEDLIEWLHDKCIERGLSAQDAIAILGIVVEGLIKGVHKDAGARRREASRFAMIFNHVMGLDGTARGVRWH